MPLREPTRQNSSLLTAILKTCRESLSSPRLSRESCAEIIPKLAWVLWPARIELNGDIQRLDQKIDRVAVEVVKTQVQIDGISERLAGTATKDDVNRIMNAVDAFAGKSQNYDRAATLHGQALTELATQAKDPETRLKTIESAGR